MFGHCLTYDELLHSTMKGPSTKTSILVRRRHSTASSGEFTIGPSSLNEVFSNMGTPVSSLKAWIKLPINRVRAAADRLQTAGAVNVGWGRDLRLLFRDHRVGHEHER